MAQKKITKEILVNAPFEETRIAILENGRLSELLWERRNQRSTVGNIYRGTVENVLPTVLTTEPTGAGQSVASVIRVGFSEAMDPSTIFGSRVGFDGSFHVRHTPPAACDPAGEDDVFGCISMGSGGKPLSFTPVSPWRLIDETSFTATIKSNVSDRAGIRE